MATRKQHVCRDLYNAYCALIDDLEARGGLAGRPEGETSVMLLHRLGYHSFAQLWDTATHDATRRTDSDADNREASEDTPGAAGGCMWIRLDGTRCGAAVTGVSPGSVPHCGQHGDGGEAN
jgi:hypothetical protein